MQPQHMNFMREYVALMGPVARALDVLKSEKNCNFGYVIPTIVYICTDGEAECSDTWSACDTAISNGTAQWHQEAVLRICQIQTVSWQRSHTLNSSCHTFLLNYMELICWSLIMKWMWWMQQNQLYSRSGQWWLMQVRPRTMAYSVLEWYVNWNSHVALKCQKLVKLLRFNRLDGLILRYFTPKL